MHVHVCAFVSMSIKSGIIQLVKTAKGSFMKHQFDPVEDKYVYSLLLWLSVSQF